jgi:GntR family transcriptional repressor for pyruvate dehydrogenase complex
MPNVCTINYPVLKGRTPVKRKSSRSKKIYEQVAEHIKQMIEQGFLKPGDKLPPMNELAVQFGVSRATVREAFSSLVGMGLIDLRHGEGTFVQKIDVQTMVTEPMNAALLLGWSDLQQLMEVRRLLETGIVGWACERAAAEDLRAIADALTTMGRAEEHLEEQVSADLQFHMAIAQASGNDVLINLMNTLSEGIRSFLRNVWAEDGQEQRLLDEHRELYEAIAARDKQRATQLLLAHLERTEQFLQQRRTEWAQ